VVPRPIQSGRGSFACASGHGFFLLFAKLGQPLDQVSPFQGPQIFRTGMAVMISGDFTVNPGRIHRVDERIEDHHVEVPQQNREGRERRLIIVNCVCAAAVTSWASPWQDWQATSPSAP
jgi:hypothetical protein